MTKRENATIWESKTTGCYEFQCHNDSGPIYWKQCNKTDEICENDQCVVTREEDVTYSVEIEVDGIDITDLNTTEIQTTISDLTGIKADKLTIRVETNDNNEVVRIIVIVNDEKTAEEVKDKINIAIDEHNEEEIVKHFVRAEVNVKENKLLVSSGSMKKEGIIIMFTIVLMSLITPNEVL